MKKWTALLLALLIALPGATTVHAEDTTTGNSSNNSSTNNSSSSSSSSSTEPSSVTTSTDNINSSSNSTSAANQTLNISSVNKPVISLIGDAAVRLKVGTPFTDPGTTVQDDVYPDLSATETYTFNNSPVPGIDVQTPGSYVIHYNVTNPEQQAATEVTRTVKIAAIGDYIGASEFSAISLSASRGMAYYGDYVYVAQRYVGLARINLYTGKAETIVSAMQSFMGVALNTAGDLFFTRDSDPTIHKLSHTDLNDLPLSESNFNAKQTDYLTTGNPYVYGLTIDKNNNLYYTDYLHQSIMKYNPSTQTTATVISNFTTPLNSLTLDPEGNLYAGGNNSKLYRTANGNLNTLPITEANMINVTGNGYVYIPGMFFLPDGSFYVPSGGVIASKRADLSPPWTPTLVLNGDQNMTLLQGDPFTDPGVTIMQNYTPDLHPTVTYSLNGNSVPGIDTTIAGKYKIYYNLKINDYQAPVVARTVTINPLPTALTDVKVNRPFGMTYANGYVYYADYDQGLFKISTTTFQVTQIAASDVKLAAVAVDHAGNLFYSQANSNQVFKINQSDLNSTLHQLPYSASDLGEISHLYFTAPIQVDQMSGAGVNGLSFDNNDQLYIAAQDQELEVSPSKIWRLSAGSPFQPQLVAKYPAKVYGLTISPLGNLYVNVGAFQMAKANAAQLQNLPIAAQNFKLLGATNYAYGVVFLPDRTGYTSSVNSPGLTKLSFLDSLPANSITLSQSAFTMTEGDLPQQLTPTILPDNATDTELVWKSSDEDVVTVQNGMLTPVGKGTALISVYVANEPEVSATATVTVKAKPIIVIKDDKKKTSNTISLGIDSTDGKTYVPATAIELRSLDFDGSTIRNITLDVNKIPDAINTLKINQQSTVRLNIPKINNMFKTNINLPLDVSNSLSSNDMNLNIDTGNIQLSIPSNSLLNLNTDVNFNIKTINTNSDIQLQKSRAIHMPKVQQIVGNGNLSIVSQPIDIITNFQNRSVDLTIPMDHITLPANTSQTANNLYIYIDHSDGSQEFIKPIQITDDSGKLALQIKTNKFSTFTVMSVTGSSTSADATTTPVTGTNPANTAGIVKPAYIEGYPDGTFRPHASLNRAELASLLSRLQATSNSTSTAKSFNDVPTSFWAQPAIQAMQTAGLMSGLPNGTFAPSKPITRAEMAIILARWQRLSGQSGTTFASDMNGHWAEREIKLVLTAGLMQGVSTTRFEPNAPLTRAQAVTILNKIVKQTANMSPRPTLWKDVPSSHWAYADIMEASNSYSLK